MSYKTLLTHVEPGEDARWRVRLAVALAARFDAALIGLGARAFDVWPDPTAASHQALKEAIEADLEQARQVFEEETAGLRGPVVWRTATDYPAAALAETACGADLIVAAGTCPKPFQTFADPGALIVGAGAPVLIAPEGTAGVEADKVLIGWKNTREARRAVADALPFLTAAREVEVVRVHGAQEETPESLDLVAQRLRRHGVNARCAMLARGAGSVAQDLQEAAASRSAGLIVTGGYGHSRLQELVLGGVTRGLLGQAAVPVLFSH